MERKALIGTLPVGKIEPASKMSYVRARFAKAFEVSMLQKNLASCVHGRYV